jgi:hypothetical protein
MVLCLWEAQINNFLLAVVLNNSNLSIRRIVTIVWYAELRAVIGKTTTNCVGLYTISESLRWREDAQNVKNKAFCYFVPENWILQLLFLFRIFSC